MEEQNFEVVSETETNSGNTLLGVIIGAVGAGLAYAGGKYVVKPLVKKVKEGAEKRKEKKAAKKAEKDKE